MTTIELRTDQYEAAETVWANTDTVETSKRNSMLSRFGDWVTGVVYGVDAPTNTTYERFSGQASQVPRFLDQHSFSVGDNIVLGEE